jgi:hypothetical protein
MVSVFPGIFPASMIVAPNSPMARAKERTAPAMSPFFARGKITFIAVLRFEWPRVYDAFMRSLSTDSIAARAVFTIRGSATTKDASTAACHVNMTDQPVASKTGRPRSPFLPNRIIR